MLPDPYVHTLIANDRTEALRAAYGAGPRLRPRRPRGALRRRVGLALVSLGLRLADPRPEAGAELTV